MLIFRFNVLLLFYVLCRKTERLDSLAGSWVLNSPSWQREKKEREEKDRHVI